MSNSDDVTKFEKPKTHRKEVFVETHQKIMSLMQDELYGVLCTSGQNHAYGSLLAYAYSPDLKNIFFATPITTRKYQLLSKEKRIAFVVDSRSKKLNQLMDIEAITATGVAVELDKSDNNKIEFDLLANRHPFLKQMLSADSFAVFKMEILRYFYVTSFQEVEEWIPAKTG